MIVPWRPDGTEQLQERAFADATCFGQRLGRHRRRSGTQLRSAVPTVAIPWEAIARRFEIGQALVQKYALSRKAFFYGTVNKGTVNKGTVKKIVNIEVFLPGLAESTCGRCLLDRGAG